MTNETEKQSFGKQSLYTFWTVIIGLTFLFFMFLITVLVFRDAKSVVAVMGAVTGVLGTLVGYVAGQAGKDKAENRATKAEQKLTAVVSEGGKDVLKQAKNASSISSQYLTKLSLSIL